MNLQDHPGLQVSFIEFLVNVDHSDFNHIRCSSLNRHIDSLPFGILPDVLIVAADVCNVPPAAKQCADISFFACPGNRISNILLNFWKPTKITRNNFFGFTLTYL